MDKAKLKPLFINDKAGHPVAVQVDLESFQHVLELIASLLEDGHVPAGVPASEPLLKRLAGLLAENGDNDDPRELLEDLLDSITLLRAKIEPEGYVDYEDVRAELLELDKR